MAELMFHGAVEEVTGSMHMIRMDGHWIALDCGIYHGRRAEAEKRNRDWPVPAAEISAVILSHAHIDHSGRLPRLVHDGFDGAIYCTPATRDLCAIMLPDSAYIQEEDAEYVNKRRKRKGLDPIEALYTRKDAVKAISLMQSISYDRWFQVESGLMARFQEAGHILGSAGIHLEFGKRNGHTPSLYFSGDVGRPNKVIVRDPAPFPPCDVLLCESTYGGRANESIAEARTALIDIVRRTHERGGKVVIPAFSVGRTQTIAYYLQEAMLNGELPKHPVFVDSPLAVSATEVFLAHPECYDEDARDLHSRNGGLLDESCCTFIRSVDESKQLHKLKKPCTILSASGMCEAGRIRHHIKNNIEDKRSTLLIAGYQAGNTLGRKLAEGAKTINLFHEEYRVLAEVRQIHGFSAHADQADLLRLLEPVRDHAKQIYLIHGEAKQRATLAAKLAELGFDNVNMGQPGQRVEL